MKSSNLSSLVQDAVEYRQASASNGKWVAHLVRGDPVFDPEMLVQVWHHGTHMFDCRVIPFGLSFSGPSAKEGVAPVDSGHGSTSDRCGVRRITAGAYGDDGIGYKELYEGSHA